MIQQSTSRAFHRALLLIAAIGTAGAAHAVDIIDLHRNTSQGVPASPYTIGTPVTVTGIITVAHATFSPNYLDVYLQDDTAGVLLYSPSVPYTFQLGDSVTIVGEIDQYRGMTEVVYQSHTLHAHSADIPAPLVVSCDDVEHVFQPDYTEPDEGRLVRLNNVTWSGSWPTGSGGVTLHDPSGTCVLYIDQTTGIQNMTPPTGPFDVVGVIKQFAGYAPPYTSGYELLPRTVDDFYLLPGPQVLEGPVETNLQADNVTIHLVTDTPTTAVVHYGLTASHEIGSATDGTVATVHDIVVPNLAAATIYHYAVTVENTVGQSTTADRLFSSASAPGCTGQILCYFNDSVDHAYAGPTLAAGNEDFTTRIIERIDAAESTIDIAMYSFDLANVADALIAAKNRGVVIRFVYDYRSPYQTQVQRLISAGIPVIDDTFGPNNGEGLMHDKFWVFDALHADPTRPWAVTGSWNVTSTGTYTDQQNLIMIQDQAVARVFRAELNEMWGSAIWLPNPDHSRFGANKIDDTPKLFNVGGRELSVYFAPSDAWMNAMVQALREADTSVDFSILSFTRYELTNEMADLFYGVPGFAVRGVFDSGQTGDPNSQWWPMSGQGSYAWNPPADVWLDAETGLLHHKYMLIDSQSPASDPVLVTGSTNWSGSAMNENDENLILLHDADIVNQYLQEFAERYHAAGGTSLEPSSAAPESRGVAVVQLGPSLTTRELALHLALEQSGPIRLDLYGVDGRLIDRLLDRTLPAGHHSVSWDAGRMRGLSSGVYFLRLTGPSGTAERRIAVVK